MRFVIRIGGSVIGSPINPLLITKYVDLFINLKKAGHEFVVIVGGGSLARQFISIAQRLGLDEQSQDKLAISVSRLLAQLFLHKLGSYACSVVPVTIDEVVTYFKSGKISIMGGLKPGMTTDGVAAMIVTEINANLLIKATNQEGIFDKDPKLFDDAVKFETLSFLELSQILRAKKHKAGIHQIIDPETVRMLQKIDVTLMVVNGFNPNNVSRALRGERVGTTVQ